MRRTTAIAAALLLLASGCRDKTPPPAPAAEKETEAHAPQPATTGPVPPEEEAGPAVATSDVQAIKRDGPVLEPRLAWTGTHFAVVWVQVPIGGNEAIHGILETHPGMPGAISLRALDSFTMHLVLVDGGTATAGEPVALAGAGGGPKALSGPALSMPAWQDGTLALAWSLWNEEAKTGLPARYVLGRWKPDGTPVSDPIILSKDQVHHTYIDWAPVLLNAVGSDLSVSWAVERTPAEADCKDMHGIQDGIAGAIVEPDGSFTIEYACGDVIHGYDVQTFGDSTCLVLHNEHIGYHTWVMCPGGSGEYYESVNPYDRHLAVSGGLAVWYDELDEEFELKGRCLDIFRPDDKAIVCARFKSMRLAWNEEGLAVEILTKDGQTHALPLSPGDHVPAKLLRRALEKKVPFVDAVWSGHSIGLAWSKGRQLRYEIVGPDGLKSGEPPPSTAGDPSP
jgi:hypothetical protein